MTLREKIDEYKEDFSWRTQDGDILLLEEMDTKHVFNSMKMIYNHLASRYNKETVWFTKFYTDYAYDFDSFDMALTICIFYEEIEKRGNLPMKYAQPYYKIVSALKTWSGNNEFLLTTG
mgnify:CR=1 FL=1|jgi:hypothetical protein